MQKKKYQIETQCVQGSYEPKSGEPRVFPIVQSTTFKYEDSDMVAGLFDLTAEGHFYTRLGNPTLDELEDGNVGGWGGCFVHVFRAISFSVGST